MALRTTQICSVTPVQYLMISPALRCLISTYISVDWNEMDQRILQLALETLQAKRLSVEKEIAELRARMEPNRSGTAKTSAKKRTLRLSKAERLRRSKRMAAYWAAKRKEKAKAKKPVARKPPAPASPKSQA